MQIVYDLHGLTKAAIWTGLLSCIPALLAVLAMVVHAGLTVKDSSTAIVLLLVVGLAIIVASALAILLRVLGGKLPGWLKVPVFLLGAALAGRAGFLLLIEIGNGVFYIWFFLIGASLLVLAAEAFYPDPEAN